jgi:hypothetical protein
VPDKIGPPDVPPDLLRGLSRSSLATGRAADLTYEYLEAGVDLIAQALDHDPREGVHPFLGWLSQRAVIDATAARGVLRGGVGTLRDRWEPHSRYLADLIEWIRYKRPDRSFTVREADFVSSALGSHATASQLIRGLSRAVQQGVFVNPLFRLQVLFVSVLGSPKYRASEEHKAGAPNIYVEVDKRWLEILGVFLDTNHLELRPGLHETDVIEILTAVGEGLALRELADPTAGARRERRLRLQGTVALALLAACVDRGDGLTLDALVDQYQSSTDGFD